MKAVENQEQRPKLSHYTRTAVETSAIAAARENRKPIDACPYLPSWAPEEYRHWMAVYLTNGGSL